MNSDRTFKNAKNSKFIESEDPFYNISKVSSTTDCTGLVPAGIVDDEESEAYGELYAIHPPKAPHDRARKD